MTTTEQKCARCNGTGQVDNIGDGPWACRVCDGTGRIRDVSEAMRLRAQLEDQRRLVEALAASLQAAVRRCGPCERRSGFMKDQCPECQADLDLIARAGL